MEIYNEIKEKIRTLLKVDNSIRKITKIVRKLSQQSLLKIKVLIINVN